MQVFQSTKTANSKRVSSVIDRAWLRKFADDESGVLVGFGIFLFLIILMIGGIGVDVMHSEMKRTRLQHTLDRAILAAADLDQTRTPSEVVNDYFDKSDLSGHLTSIVVDDGLNYRSVTASAETVHQTSFMKLVGVDTLSVPASGAAVEQIGNIEISLVVDVSGSMNNNSRLSNLKIAAKQFIETMDDNTEDGTMSVSIIPYATQVSAPDELFAQLNVSNEHSYSNCIDFDASDFSATGVSTTEYFQRAMYFDPWNESDGRDNDPMRLSSDPVCEASDAREMVILEDNTTTLTTFIDNLSADGNTSIDLGMKWGTALLAPELQSAVTQMIEDSQITSDFEGRPYDFGTTDALKVIVLMTDGQNTTQYYIEDDYRDGASNVWWNEQEEIYSVYVGVDEDDEDGDGITEEPWFYWPAQTSTSGADIADGWHDHAYGDGIYEGEESDWEQVCSSYKRNGSCKRYKWVEVVTITEIDEPGVAATVSYPELWAYTTPRWVADQLYAPWMGSSAARADWDDGVQGTYENGTKNTRTETICNAAKAKGVIVFTIGFEAPSDGQAVLQNCASSDSHYFDVAGLEIKDAFAAIATSIRQLRLTQ